MKVAVIGAGYVGQVSAAGLAAVGHEVALYDVAGARARALASGSPDIAEPGLADLVRRADGRLRAATSLADALAGVQIALICVGTPSHETGDIDLAQVRRSVSDIAAIGAPVVVAIRSTVVPGTTDALDAEFLAPLRSRGHRIVASSNPEFLREGRAVRDLMDPDRVVIGATDETACDVLRELYEFAADRVQVMSAASAELTKYANNALLAMLVSFSNELAEIAERVPGADVTAALRGVHADRRWTEAEGPWRPAILSYLWPGCGYGGSCLPKDVKAFAAAAAARGAAAPLLRAIDSTNERQAARLAERVARRLPLRGTRVAVLGTAFKEDTDDVRSSPGLAVANALIERGADVITFDPTVRTADGAPDLATALRDARAWVVVTGAAEFDGLSALARQRGALLVDARRRFRDTSGDYLGPGIGP